MKERLKCVGRGQEGFGTTDEVIKLLAEINFIAGKFFTQMGDRVGGNDDNEEKRMGKKIKRRYSSQGKKMDEEGRERTKSRDEKERLRDRGREMERTSSLF